MQHESAKTGPGTKAASGKGHRDEGGDVDTRSPVVSTGATCSICKIFSPQQLWQDVSLLQQIFPLTK